MRSLRFDFASQDILQFRTAAEEEGASCRHCNWSPDICVCVCKPSHHVCCVQCCVHPRTDSTKNLKIEKKVIMAKDTQPPLSVRVLAVTFHS